MTKGKVTGTKAAVWFSEEEADLFMKMLSSKQSSGKHWVKMFKKMKELPYGSTRKFLRGGCVLTEKEILMRFKDVGLAADLFGEKQNTLHYEPTLKPIHIFFQDLINEMVAFRKAFYDTYVEW